MGVNKEELSEDELEQVTGGKKSKKKKKTIYKCNICGEEFEKKSDRDNHESALHKSVLKHGVL